MAALVLPASLNKIIIVAKTFIFNLGQGVPYNILFTPDKAHSEEKCHHFLDNIALKTGKKIILTYQPFLLNKSWKYSTLLKLNGTQVTVYLSIQA